MTSGMTGASALPTITTRLTPERMSSMPCLTLYRKEAQAPMMPAVPPAKPST